MFGTYTQKKLLEIIDHEESYDELLSKQITYSEIANMLVYLLENKYICNSENGYIVTKKGKNFIKEKSKFEIIEPLNECKIAKMHIDEIYYSDYIEEVLKELKN